MSEWTSGLEELRRNSKGRSFSGDAPSRKASEVAVVVHSS